MINHLKYYKTFLRYGLGYEGDAWFANNYISAFKKKGFYINKVLKDFGDNDRCIVSTKI